MMRIHADFIGGNAVVVNQIGDDIYIENELRDTQTDWFYWAFCVEGAAGRRLTFHFQKKRLGYFGPAVSHDLEHWHWLDRACGNDFTYRFGEAEEKVYFAHNILYHPTRFYAFAERHGLEIKELCKSRRGSTVPYVTLGDGDLSIIMTARHHACESTGSYVLEGVLMELIADPIPNARVFCVPFVDYDGVVAGDQGKNRSPHDHNRDYTDAPIYPETAAIKAYADENGCHFGLDFHSPNHKGGRNDTIYIVRNRVDRNACYDRFSMLLASECGDGSMIYREGNDYPPLTGWNQPSPNFAFTMHSRPECKLAFTLENAYFGTEENKVSAERLIALGRAYARALKKYITE